MKSNMKIFSAIVVLSLTSSFAFAELAGAKGGGDAAAADTKKTGCPVKPTLDPKTAKTCPTSLGETPLTLDNSIEMEVEEYHPETESYALRGTELPDEGDIPVSLEALANAVKKGDAEFNGAKGEKAAASMKKYLTTPCDLLQKKFKVKNIQTLSNADLKARKDCVRK